MATEIERQLARQLDPVRGEVDVMRERVADHLGLLVDLLRHEVAVVALVDQERRGVGADHRPCHDPAGHVLDGRAVAGEHDEVAVLEVADLAGERRERDGVGAEIHLAVAVADRERRAFARPDQEVFLAGKQEGEREGALEPRQRQGDGGDRPGALRHLVGDEMGDHLGVGLGHELGAAGLELGAQLGEVLDDAVVDHRDPVGRVGMGIDLVRAAVGRPAGVADADGARQRLLREPYLEIAELTLGAAAGEAAAFERRHTCRVVAAVFQALQSIDDARRDRRLTEDSDDSAHEANPSFKPCSSRRSACRLLPVHGRRPARSRVVRLRVVRRLPLSQKNTKKQLEIRGLLPRLRSS